MLPLLKVDELFSLKEPEPNRALMFSLVSSIFLGAKTGDSKTAERRRRRGGKLVRETLQRAFKNRLFFSFWEDDPFGRLPCEL